MKVSLRYPLVELVCGLLAVALWLEVAPRAGVPPAELGRALAHALVPWVLGTTFVVTLVTLALMDLDWFVLPDAVTVGLALLGLAAAFALGGRNGAPTPGEAAVGGLVGGVLPWLAMHGYALATKRDGLGGGDWKLLMAIGAWLGARGLPFVLFAGALQGLFMALVFRRDFAVAELPPLPGEAPSAPREADAPVPFRQLAVPFGPFLALAAIEWVFFGKDLLQWWHAHVS